MTTAISAIMGFLLILTFVTGVRQMMLAVMLVRPSCDQAFDWLKMSFNEQSGPGAAINALVLAMAIIAVVHVPQVLLAAPMLSWAAFLLTAAISLIHTPDIHGGLRVFLTLVTYAAAFGLPYTVIQRRETIVQCLTVAVGSSLLPSFVALLEFARTPDILIGEQRLQSTFTHPNIYAFYIVVVVTVILYMTCSATITLSKFTRRAMFAYAAYLAFLLLLTKTRSAWISMLIIVIGYSLVVDRRYLVAMLGLPTVLLIPGVTERVSDLYSGTIDAGFEQLNSWAWRQVIWRDTLEWMATNPSGILGYGLNAYQSYMPTFFPRGERLAKIGLHNAFLQIYFEMGLAGLISFLLLMAAVAFTLICRFREDFSGSFVMLLLCVGYMVVFYSDNLLDYLQFQWLFWFTLGSVCASARLAAMEARAPLRHRLIRAE
ncbi:O-antigen ligase family protein [Bradyrhizobium sp. AZCC 1693]|uniref:O-antigen ligase family protein n=1 Tax=Bradyrhizobium sp. AZCC 1693 TaxID=3117029 RepID=UPI002FEF3628